MGTPSLIIPAFSPAINSIVSPNILVCSNPIDVITHNVGLETTLVASNLPPNPVSNTTTSAWSDQGRVLGLQAENIKMYNEENCYKLCLKHLDLSQAGKYRVVARNRLGESCSSCQLDVKNAKTCSSSQTQTLPARLR